jgi:hypothetical protein
LGEAAPAVHLVLEHGKLAHAGLGRPLVVPEAGLLRLLGKLRYLVFKAG